MATNRYKQLMAAIPKGAFYASDGQVLPFRSTPYQLRVSTGVPDAEYGVFLNENFRGSVVTNSQSVALLNIQLYKGFNEIKLIEKNTQRTTTAIVTTRDYATLLASEAQVLETIDVGVEQVLLDAHIETSSVGLIEDVFGRTVDTANNVGYSLDVYRELLQELRTAYRCYGGTMHGIAAVVRAFTQTSPLIFPSTFGPAWLLGKDLISPKISTASHTYYTTGTLAAIQGTGAGISIKSLSGQVGVGVGSVKVTGNTSPKKLSWASSLGAFGKTVDVTANGTYTLYDGEYTPRVVGVQQNYVITAGANDKIALEIGTRGVLTVTLTPGTRTAAQIASDINTAFAGDVRYGATYNSVASATSGVVRIALTTPSAGLDINPIKIYTATGTADAAQTLFDLPLVRGGLNVSHSAGATLIQLSATTDMSTWPKASVDCPLTLVIGRTTFHPTGTPNAAAALPGAVLATAIAVDTINKTLTLDTGLSATQPANAMVELTGQMPFQQSPVLQPRSIQVDVSDHTAMPSSVVTDTFTISGTGLPDGWVRTNNAGTAIGALGPSIYNFFDLDRDLPVRLASDTMLTIPISDEALNYRGMNALIGIWGSYYDPATATPRTDVSQIGISFDDGANYTYSAPTVTGKVVDALKRPREYSLSVQIPVDATGIKVRLKLTADSGEFLLHRIRFTIPGVHSGMFLGDGTIPRNETKIKSGQIMYVWSRDVLTTPESAVLGMDSVSQSLGGHIDKISPSHAWIDKFNVTSYTGQDPINLKGVFTDADFISGLYNNLELVLRTPARFTHLKPTTFSDHTETVTWSAGNQHILGFESDQDQNTAVLFEDGLPMDPTDWSFSNSTVISKTTAPNPLVKYEIKYKALIRFQSGTIDLGAAFADYLWYADYHAYTRPEISPISTSIESGLQFDVNGSATLSEITDLDQLASTLIEDTGLTTRTVPLSDWSYTDNKHVQISSSAINQGALYTIRYTALVNHPTTDVELVVEIRSAATSPDLQTAVWGPISRNGLVGNSNRFHQMRVTAYNVRDIRDVRIQSLLLKGLGLFGAGLTVPVLRP